MRGALFIIQFCYRFSIKGPSKLVMLVAGFLQKTVQVCLELSAKIIKKKTCNIHLFETTGQINLYIYLKVSLKILFTSKFSYQSSSAICRRLRELYNTWRSILKDNCSVSFQTFLCFSLGAGSNSINNWFSGLRG